MKDLRGPATWCGIQCVVANCLAHAVGQRMFCEIHLKLPVSDRMKYVAAHIRKQRRSSVTKASD